MPWLRYTDFRYSDPEWAEQLQQQVEESERQERLEEAFLANTHTLDSRQQAQRGQAN